MTKICRASPFGKDNSLSSMNFPPSVAIAVLASANSSSDLAAFKAKKKPSFLTKGRHNSAKTFKRATALAVT